jgi:hypothetical protein
MNHRRCLVALSANTMVFALLLAGCGGYESDDDSATGGDTASGGGTATGGGTASGGSTASGGGTATGGTQSGTGGGSATCTNVTPCGGDLVGTWNVTSSCLTVSGEVDLSAFGLGCSSAPVAGSLQVSGTWTANADGTYSDNTTTTGNEQLELPASCREISGTTTTCDRIGGPITSVGYASVTCTDDTATGGCSCQATMDQAAGIGLAPTYVAASGNYTTSGSTLTITAGEVEYSYCVSGTTLTMTPQSVGKTATLTGSVELQRQ